MRFVESSTSAHLREKPFMRVLLFALTLAALMITISPVHADIAPPVPQPREVKVVIRFDEKAKGPIVEAPQNVLFPRAPRVPIRQPKKEGAQPNAQPQANPFDGGEEGVIFEPTAEGDEEPPVASRPSSHTTMAGVALAMSVGFGGLWFLRRDGRSLRPLVLMIAAGGMLTAGALVWGNGAPIQRPMPETKIGGTVMLEGKATLLMPVGGDSITIVLDKESLKALLAPPVPAPK